MEKKMVVLYATLTGNTQMAAMQLADFLGVESKSVEEVTFEEYKNYDLLILGVSTWGEGEYNPATEDWIAKINQENPNLKEVRFALFGLGDRSYVNFCGAIDKVSVQLKSAGVNIVGEIHKIDGFVDEDKQKDLEKWARNLTENF